MPPAKHQIPTASNFIQRMRRSWDAKLTKNWNAVDRAKRLGAKCLGPVKIDEFLRTPGDIKASLWEFADGTKAVIWDDGSGAKAHNSPDGEGPIPGQKIENVNGKIAALASALGQFAKEGHGLGRIIFKGLPDGSFIAGDRETNLTSYAYPTSTNARAARKHPEIVARAMMEAEGHFLLWSMAEVRICYDVGNWRDLWAGSGPHGSTEAQSHD